MPHPVAELTDHRVLVAGLARLIDESEQVGRGDEGKGTTDRRGHIRAVGVEDMEDELVPVEPPYLGDVQRCIDAHAVEGTARHIDLNRKVGRGIDAKVEPPAPSDPRSVGNPETVIGFDPAPASSAAKCDGTATMHRQSKFFSQDDNEAPEETCIAIVFEQRRHDFELPAIVG